MTRLRVPILLQPIPTILTVQIHQVWTQTAKETLHRLQILKLILSLPILQTKKPILSIQTQSSLRMQISMTSLVMTNSQYSHPLRVVNSFPNRNSMDLTIIQMHFRMKINLTIIQKWDMKDLILLTITRPRDLIFKPIQRIFRWAARQFRRKMRFQIIGINSLSGIITMMSSALKPLIKL